MANIYIYGDESGKFRNSAFVSMCGYVGQRDDWQELSSYWADEMGQRGLPPIHMSQMFSPTPKAAWREVRERYGPDDWPGARSRIIERFANLVRAGKIYAVGAVVDAEHFRNLPDSEFKRFYQDPVFLGLYVLLFSGIRRISRVDPWGSVGFVVDDDPETAPKFYQRLNRIRQMPHELCVEIKKRIGAITFARDGGYPGLQAADMLAYVARRRLLAGSDVPWPTDLYDTLRPGGDQRWPLIFDGTLLDRMAASGPRLEG
ncbi:MAG: DUF3800 domain-containing protein [Terracidiphilus sp.]